MTEVDQTTLLERLRQEHVQAGHPGGAGERLRLHLAIHMVVETQLADRGPAAAGETLSRLLEAGLTRHDAIHAIGTVASEEVLACLSDPARKYDETRYVARLGQLDPAALLAEVRLAVEDDPIA